MSHATPSTTSAICYRFAGAFVASRLPGIPVGTSFHGTLRYDPHSRPVATEGPESRFADPCGSIEATVGAWRLQSAGLVEIGIFSTPRVCQLALSATPQDAAGEGIRSCRVLLLAGGPLAAADGLPDRLDEGSFDTRSFTLEDESFTRFAIGTITALARLDRPDA